jgi:hypothetical protein
MAAYSIPYGEARPGQGRAASNPTDSKFAGESASRFSRPCPRPAPPASLPAGKGEPADERRGPRASTTPDQAPRRSSGGEGLRRGEARHSAKHLVIDAQIGNCCSNPVLLDKSTRVGEVAPRAEPTQAGLAPGKAPVPYVHDLIGSSAAMARDSAFHNLDPVRHWRVIAPARRQKPELSRISEPSSALSDGRVHRSG